MIWLSRVNAALVGLCLLLFGAWVIMMTLPVNRAAMPEIIKRKASKPINAFAQSDQAYARIGPPWLSLNFVPPTLQLPDLSREVVYHGKNNRPDLKRDQTLLHISLKAGGRSQSIQSVPPGVPIYLRYDRSQTPPRFVFTPNNEKSSLWITIESEEENAAMNVFMSDEEGNIITEPDSHHVINLPEKELPRFRGEPWELAGNRVDAGLLARQKTKWYGHDLFLEMHGGDAFADLKDRDLVIFGEGDDQYYHFLKEGSWLVWKEGKWQKATLGADTWQLPLLQVRKIEDRILKFDLWDSEGKARVSLNLVKAREIAPLRRLQSEIRFISARTRSQAIVEIKGERVSVNLKEWLLHNEEQAWVKLQTVEQIDDYVDLKLKGELLVIDALEKRDGKQILTGHLFSAMRSEVAFVELSADGQGMEFIEKPEQEKEDVRQEFPPRGLSPEELNALRKQYLEEQEKIRDKRMPRQDATPQLKKRLNSSQKRLQNEDDEDDEEEDLESMNDSRVRMRVRGMFGGVSR